jgi:hypothetical protein
MPTATNGETEARRRSADALDAATQARLSPRVTIGQATPKELEPLRSKLHPDVDPRMPIDMALKASANLFQRDATEARMLKAHPDYYREGPGIVIGRTQVDPQTTSVALPQFTAPPARASSTDLVNQAIDAKRQDIAARKQDVFARMSSISGRRDKWGRDESRRLGAELHSLEADDRAALQEHHYNMMAAAHQVTLADKQERDIHSANQHIGLLDGLRQISSQYPVGTKEHAEAVLNLRGTLAQQYPLGKLPKEGEELLKAHSAIHDDLASLRARAEAAGFTVTGFKTTKEGGVDVQAKSADQIAREELKTAYGLTPEQIQKPVSVRVGNVTYNEKDESQFTGDRSGAHVRIDTGSKKKGFVDLPVETYLKHGGTLSPEDTAAQTKAGRVASQAPSQQPAAEEPELVHYDFRTPTGVIGHDLPSGVPKETLNAISSAYQKGDQETASRLAIQASAPAPSQPEKVMVQKGGKQFRLPRGQLQDALGQGYELVQ